MQLISRLGAGAGIDPQDRLWAVGRSLLGLAQLGPLMFTPSRIQLLHVRSGPGSTQCSGIARLTLWCVGGSPRANTLAMSVAVVVLVGVVAGLWPRRLCIPHWFVAFSVNADVTVGDGGAMVAAIATLLLIPQCLGDDRASHWSKPGRPLRPAWSGAAHAATLLLRVQLATVYTVAAVSKLRYPAWRNGRALLILSGDPQFGFPGSWRPPADHLLSISWLGDVLTWSVPVVELAIALALLAPKPLRIYGLALVILLHGAIMSAMGLLSFGAVMIATALMATSAASGREGSGAVRVRDPSADAGTGAGGSVPVAVASEECVQ